MNCQKQVAITVHKSPLFNDNVEQRISNYASGAKRRAHLAEYAVAILLYHAFAAIIGTWNICVSVWEERLTEGRGCSGGLNLKP